MCNKNLTISKIMVFRRDSKSVHTKENISMTRQRAFTAIILHAKIVAIEQDSELFSRGSREEEFCSGGGGLSKDMMTSFNERSGG